MKRPVFVKRKYLFEYPLTALQGLAGIADGLIMLLSCGSVVSCFAIEVCKVRTNLLFKQLKNK